MRRPPMHRRHILNDKSGPIALWAFWALCVVAATVFWLVVASGAEAVGPLVGPACKLYFTAPTTNTDGSAIPAGSLTYSAYLVQSATQPVTPPGTATINSVVGFTAVGDTNAPPLTTWQMILCNNTATATGAVAVPNAGQWWVAITANEMISGAPVASALSAWAPFVLGGPNPPATPQVK